MTKVSVVIARFQVPRLHAGHRALLDLAIRKGDETVLLLGCSDTDGRTPENPLLFRQREAIVQREYPDLRCMPLPNQKDNRDWSKIVDMIVFSAFPGSVATIYVGENSDVLKCYVTKRCAIDAISLIGHHSGTKIRESIEMQTSGAFLEGQCFALNYQYPRVFPCVDVAVMRGTEVLLIQRADTGAWCLPGGFVDPTDPTLESAAKRELYEETKLSVEGDVEYVSSRKIHDWRYRGRDQIISTLFQAPLTFGTPTTTKECSGYKWFDLRDTALSGVDLAHGQFIGDLRKAYL